MADILYKTGSGSLPQDKPRVYYTCHPNDFELYFERISNDILRASDCVIYFTRDVTEAFHADEREVDLDRINLIVVPVTKKLLTEPCRAMRYDIPYAQKEHIPILPIVMEEVPLELYSAPEAFGELQYLSAVGYDGTAISYDSKLSKYLSEVLISDGLRKRIREAFPAYVFLSYRKKDRRYANTLMKLIHNVPALWDVAVWYDEFLLPGESFRINIERALKDSRLFAMVVTPSILEEPHGLPNYVMSTEYPTAKSKGIKILPIEMISTDKAQLAVKFDGIPRCVDPYADGFELRLTECFSFEKAYGDNDPQHDYLIGVAYLDGVDMEIDRERAIPLITRSAECGCEDAVRKLISMYGNGDGVAMSKAEELKWTRELIKICEKQLEESCSMSALIKLQTALMEYTDILFCGMANIEEAVRVCLGALKSFEERVDSVLLAGKGASEVNIALNMEMNHVWCAEVRTKIGTMLYDKDEYDAAEKLYFSSLDTLLKIKNHCDDEEYSYVKVVEEAQGISLSQSCGILSDIAQNYHFLGEIEKCRKNYEKAQLYFKEQLKVAGEAYAMYPGEQYTALQLSNAIISNTMLSYKVYGKCDSTVRDLEKALKLLRDHSSDDVIQFAISESTCNQHLTRIYMANGDIDKAFAHFSASFNINKMLVIEKGLALFKHNLAIDTELFRQLCDYVYTHIHTVTVDPKILADVYFTLNDPDRRHDIERLADRLYERYRKIGEDSFGVDKIAMADTYFEYCLDIRRFLAEARGRVKDVRALGEEYERLARFMSDTDRCERSPELYVAALEAYERAFAETKGKQDKNNISRLKRKLFMLNLKKFRFRSAVSYIK